MAEPVTRADRKPVFAVALSAGGARGLAHIGVLKVLQQNGIVPDLIVGTSVGGLIGAAFAAGVPIRQIEDVARSMRWRDLGSFSFSFTGVSTTDRMEKLLMKLMPTRTFEGLKIPVVVCATDIVTGEKVLFRQGDLFTAIRASCALPGIYAPVQVGPRLCADGGMTAYLPTREAREAGADIVLASDVRSETAMPHPPRNIYQVLVQAFAIATYCSSVSQAAAADVMVTPNLKKIGWEDLQQAGEIMVAGEFAMKGKISEVQELLKGGIWKRLRGSR